MSNSEVRRDPIPGLSTILREERLHRGLSVKELAEKSGVSRSMLHKIESNERTPGPLVVQRLYMVLGEPWGQKTLDLMMNDLVERST
jgi:transcriptional regulator with XRE-family HTH domain